MLYEVITLFKGVEKKMHIFIQVQNETGTDAENSLIVVDVPAVGMATGQLIEEITVDADAQSLRHHFDGSGKNSVPCLTRLDIVNGPVGIEFKRIFVAGGPRRMESYNVV